MKILPTIFIATVALLLQVEAHRHRSEESDENKNVYYYGQSNPTDLLKQENQNLRATVPENWYNEVKNYPEAEPFLSKVIARLENSREFASKPDIKNKLDELAHLKLYRCKSHNEDSLNKACMGRWTGQMMQFIAAIENDNRDLPTLSGDANRY